MARPPEKSFYHAEVQTYKPHALRLIHNMHLVFENDNLKLYQHEKDMLLAIKGTTKTNPRDLAADSRFITNSLSKSERYKEDYATVQKLLTEYPPNKYRWFLAGHSLGGGIAMQFMRDFPGTFHYTVVYNAAFQPVDILYQGEHIKRLYTKSDPLYQLGGFLFRGNQIVDDPLNVGNTVVDAAFTHGLHSFSKLYGGRIR